MGSPSSRRVFARLGVGIVGLSMALMAAGVVFAGSGSPTSIHVDSNSGMIVQVSGKWTWSEMASAKTLSYAGFAIDWGDVTSGNTLGGKYHIGDGTAATNVVMQPTTPARGSSGSWGPVSHTYAKAGDYTVCAIIYDLGETKPFKTAGYHSLKATGVDYNNDNSVDQHNEPAVQCTTITVSDATPAPTQTPFQSFAGITAPPTGTVAPQSGDNSGSPALPLFLLAISGLASTVVFKTVKVRR
jgi:hypothetical protein